MHIGKRATPTNWYHGLLLPKNYSNLTLLKLYVRIQRQLVSSNGYLTKVLVVVFLTTAKNKKQQKQQQQQQQHYTTQGSTHTNNSNSQKSLKLGRRQMWAV